MKHPSPEQLLAWLDGEVHVVERLQVNRHTRRCWDCRSRAAEIESAIARLRLTTTDDGDLGAVDIAKARWRLREAIAREKAATPPPSRRSLRLPLLAAAVALLGLVALWLPYWKVQPRRASPENPRQILLGIETAETRHFDSAVRKESFEIEMRSGAATVRREWRVWSAPRRGLYEARWEDTSGKLSYGAYASPATPDYVYTAENGLRRTHLRDGAEASPIYRALDLDGADGAGIERSLLAWIGRQAWRPVSLARELVEFASDGAALRIERRTGGLLCTAEATVSGRRVRMMIEAAEGERPHFLEVSWLAGGVQQVIRIARKERMDYAAPELMGVSFRPDASLFPRRASEPEPVVSSIAPAVDRRLLDSADIQVWGALHRSHLCLTDEITVSRTAESVEVSGVLPTDDRRQQLVAVLSGLPAHGVIRTNLKTPSELPAREAVPVETVAPAPRAGAMTASAEEWLRAKLRVGSAITEREMFDVMNGLVRSAEELSANGWALRRLAEQFGAHRELSLSNEDRAELLRIAEDHAIALQTVAARMRNLVDTLETGSTQAINAPGDSWQSSSVALQQASSRVAEQVLSLFASTASGDNGSIGARIAALDVDLSRLAASVSGERGQLQLRLGAVK